jgi:hypothetical protein
LRNKLFKHFASLRENAAKGEELHLKDFGSALGKGAKVSDVPSHPGTIALTVPAGKKAGGFILMTALRPGQKAVKMKVPIPPGLKAGDTFQATLPSLDAGADATSGLGVRKDSPQLVNGDGKVDEAKDDGYGEFTVKHLSIHGGEDDDAGWGADDASVLHLASNPLPEDAFMGGVLGMDMPNADMLMEHEEGAGVGGGGGGGDGDVPSAGDLVEPQAAAVKEDSHHHHHSHSHKHGDKEKSKEKSGHSHHHHHHSHHKSGGGDDDDEEDAGAGLPNAADLAMPGEADGADDADDAGWAGGGDMPSAADMAGPPQDEEAEEEEEKQASAGAHPGAISHSSASIDTKHQVVLKEATLRMMGVMPEREILLEKYREFNVVDVNVDGYHQAHLYFSDESTRLVRRGAVWWWWWWWWWVR